MAVAVPVSGDCMSDKSDEDDQAPIPAKRSKALPLVLGFNTLLLAGILVFVMRKPATAVAHGPTPAPEAGAHAGPSHEDEAAPAPTVKLENFIIQLRSVDADRYVRIALDLELGSEADKNVVVARTARIRDAVISYFSDRTLDELRGSEGMEKTKAALLKQLGEIVSGRRIKAVFITDLVVQ
jgi:flagellar protein FliL